ncbi:MAG TPA: LysR family transcriptional regulator [Acidimicrobiales bacterium]|nr:LysR family transcriptional regulator [Acidimicrobiales bacterium]
MGLQVSTQQLEYLVAIARHDRWADAAAAVGVTPSALSQGVAELERRLGVALFERDGRRRVPTADHAEVLRYAEATLAATHDLARWLAARREGGSGAVRLGMIDAAATHHFRDVLRRHRRHRPEIDLRLDVSPSRGLLDRLARAELDLVVCVEPDDARPGIAWEPLLDDPLSVVAPPPPGAGSGSDARPLRTGSGSVAQPLRTGSGSVARPLRTGSGSVARSPETWGPWVTFPAGSHTREVVADALRAVGARFDVVAESHQPEVLREMVLLGVGWSVLPLRGLDGADELDVVRADLVARRLVLARRAAAPADAAVAELATALRAGAG